MLQPIILPTHESDPLPPVFLAVVPRGNLRSLLRKDDVRPVADVIAGLNVDAARCVACRGAMAHGLCCRCGQREGGAT